MSKQAFSHLAIVIFIVMVSVVMPASNVNGQVDKANGKSVITTQPVFIFGEQTVVPQAGSILARTKEGAYMSMHSASLTPGEAITAWWAIFNNPKKCQTTPCTVPDLFIPEVQGSVVNAAGKVIGIEGTAEFGDFIAVNDTAGAVFGPGLLNAFKAEIHLVLRTHGQAMLDNPQVLKEQLTQFDGGCPPNTCEDIQASPHLPQK